MTGLGEDVPQTAGAIWRRTVPVWAGLTALLVATLSLAYVPMGRFGIVVSLGIAAAKAGLVVVFFMQLRKPDPLLRLTAFASLIFVAFLLTIIFAEVLTRAPPTRPGTVMPRSAPDMPGLGQRAF
ncbi:cytochrome C oxidase subunit IV family protein [Paracraurococcus lichenis]|uniref:Cytochrome C oxidase subunit IV family protein n=1 Tax=Paracraurococcus lichenis TaxID=3064888 RepID=A0ABT9DXZ5_9PROT|nr:cytochrome C oxidase subunit IV family protein [Paracraurococcus sp. LOR1-02]MDO9708774.1 cytochrome C oxidase subunit IV family protein [Paracraurococcus sp. LOR1-02]